MKKMNILEKKLEVKRQSGKKLFCAYITLGFPNLSFTKKIIPDLEKNGVDILELGIPFSDPTADGPIIQDAAHVSLTHKTRVADAFRIVKDVRKKGVTIPIIFFSYYNIIFSMGIKKFAKQLAMSGFDGVLCPDLTPDSDDGLQEELDKYGLSLITLIAPTSTASRRRKLARMSRGFIYYVSRRGVTGVQQSLDTAIRKNVKDIKKSTSRNVLVGFGVSSPEHVRTIASVSDGVIVGSAIIKEIKRTKSVSKTLAFIRKLARGCQGKK